jgi:hypothetical protein
MRDRQKPRSACSMRLPRASAVARAVARWRSAASQSRAEGGHLVRAAGQGEGLDEAEQHVPGPDGAGGAGHREPWAVGLDDRGHLVAAAGVGQVQGEVGGALAADDPGRLQLVGQAQLPLGGLPVAPPVGGQPEVEVADVQPGQPAALADRDHVPADPLDEGQVRPVDPLDPDAAGHDQELAPRWPRCSAMGATRSASPVRWAASVTVGSGLASVLCWYSAKASTPVRSQRSPVAS